MQSLLPVQARLGEGPHWDADSGCLWYVDILGHTIHRYHPASRSSAALILQDDVSTVVPRLGGGLVITLGRGFYALDWDSHALTLLAEVENDRPNNRFNDGKCDAKGRFWAGTLDRGEKEPLGGLYCLDLDLSVHKMLDGVTVSNGLGWSPDNQTMYYIDSATQRVAAFDYDLDRGRLSHRREIIAIDTGTPDGMTVDAEGMLWVAHWDGGRISRWDPVSGTQLAEYLLPVDRVTSLAFGGPDLTELFITSARHGISADALSRQPLAGNVFSFTAPVAGLRSYGFAG
jgi:sugar lactone lactonase YvrE